MKTKDRSCKFAEKRTGSCAQMARILPKQAAFFVLFQPWERMIAPKTSEAARRPWTVEVSPDRHHEDGGLKLASARLRDAAVARNTTLLFLCRALGYDWTLEETNGEGVGQTCSSRSAAFRLRVHEAPVSLRADNARFFQLNETDKGTTTSQYRLSCDLITG
jgi:hypothetical protein